MLQKLSVSDAFSLRGNLLRLWVCILKDVLFAWNFQKQLLKDGLNYENVDSISIDWLCIIAVIILIIMINVSDRLSYFITSPFLKISYTHTYIHIHTYNMYVCIHMYIYICIYVYLYMFIAISIYLYMFIYWQIDREN